MHQRNNQHSKIKDIVVAPPVSQRLGIQLRGEKRGRSMGRDYREEGGRGRGGEERGKVERGGESGR